MAQREPKRRSRVQRAAKADIKILQRLITAYEAGCQADVSTILNLTHGSMLAPPAFAVYTKDSLRSGSNKILSNVSTHGLFCPCSIDTADFGE